MLEALLCIPIRTGASISDSPMTRAAKGTVAVSALFVVLASAACSRSPYPLEAVEYDVPHKFIGKDGKAARDFSGIACAPGQVVRHCLVIDDEGDDAQWATLDGTSFVAGDLMPLVGEGDGAVTFGTRPEVDCPMATGRSANSTARRWRSRHPTTMSSDLTAARARKANSALRLSSWRD